MQYYSYSSMEVYKKCARAWNIKNKTPRIQLTGVAIETGSAFHVAIAEVLQTGTVNPIKDAIAFVNKRDDIPSVKTKVIRMIEDFYPRLGINTTLKAVKPEMIEYSFKIPVTSDWGLSGFIDALCETDEGKIVLIDWKCRGTLYEVEDIEYDAQLHMYYWVATQLGYEIDEVYQVQLSTKTKAMHVASMSKAKHYKIIDETFKTCQDMFEDKELKGIWLSWLCKKCDYKQRCFKGLTG